MIFQFYTLAWLSVLSFLVEFRVSPSPLTELPLNKLIQFYFILFFKNGETELIRTARVSLRLQRAWLGFCELLLRALGSLCCGVLFFFH